MSTAFCRRGFLAAALAAGVLPAAARATSPGPKRLVAGMRMLEVNGRPVRVFGLTGPNGRPGIRLDAGERFKVELVNESGVSGSLLTPTIQADGRSTAITSTTW